MVLTNMLLSLSFGVITNFCAALPPGSARVPAGPQELRVCAVGSPNSEVDLHVAGPGAARYGIRDGAVYYFSTEGSFFREGDPSRLSRYAGNAVFTSNQVLVLVSNTLQRLLKHSASLSSGLPRILQGGVFEGKRIPFFQVEWPHVTPRMPVDAAVVEVDARTGMIVFMHLLDDVFFDPDATSQLRKKVLEPEPSGQARKTANPPPQ